MFKKSFLKYLSEITGTIDSNLKKALLADNNDAYHDLRVGIKKLRAIMKIIGPALKNKKLKKSIKKKSALIFHVAGKTRDMHVHSEFASDYEKLLKTDLTGLKDFIAGNTAKSRKKFIRVASKVQQNIFCGYCTEVKKSVKTSDSQELHDLVEDFVRSRIDKLNAVKNRLSAKGLHKQRKTLKELRFTYDIIEVNDSKTIDLKSQIEQIKILEDLLGKWHDYMELKKTVARFTQRSKTAKGENIRLFISLTDAISTDIVNCLDEFYKARDDMHFDY